MILSKKFMFIVLRHKDTFHKDGRSVGVNSLGFAGTHAVKRDEDLELIREVGPTYILEKLAA
jgi:ATP adenylyltransferase/5',5'''-P-1,P-4-tetraphosphate phosphorylase II